MALLAESVADVFEKFVVWHASVLSLARSQVGTICH
jgi:hypothetical protein